MALESGTDSIQTHPLWYRLGAGSRKRTPSASVLSFPELYVCCCIINSEVSRLQYSYYMYMQVLCSSECSSSMCIDSQLGSTLQLPAAAEKNSSSENPGLLLKAAL